MIYFLKDTGSQEIKIGFSSRPPEQRLTELQTGNPRKLILLGWVPGTKADEDRYHDHYAQYRLEGEWFKGDIIEEVLATIAEAKPRRVERRQTMTENPEGSRAQGKSVPEAPSGAIDKDSGVLGVCRIPGLRMKSLVLTLTERLEEVPSPYFSPALTSASAAEVRAGPDSLECHLHPHRTKKRSLGLP